MQHVGRVAHVLAAQDVRVKRGQVPAVARDVHDRGDNAVDDGAHEPVRLLTGRERVHGRGDGAAVVVAEDDDKRGAQQFDGVFDRSDDRGVEDVPRGAHDERVAEALVEDDFCGDARVRATEDDGERVLGGAEIGAAGRVLVGVRDISVHETRVSCAQSGPGFRGSQSSRHACILTPIFFRPRNAPVW